MKPVKLLLLCLFCGSAYAGPARCVVTIPDTDLWIRFPNLAEFEGITDNTANRSVTSFKDGSTSIDYGNVRSSENCGRIAGRVYQANFGKLAISYQYSIQNTFQAK